MLKQSYFSFGDCYHFLGEEIDFLSLRNEFSSVSLKEIIVYYSNLLVKQSKICSLETKNRFLNQEGDSNHQRKNMVVLALNIKPLN